MLAPPTAPAAQESWASVQNCSRVGQRNYLGGSFTPQLHRNSQRARQTVTESETADCRSTAQWPGWGWPGDGLWAGPVRTCCCLLCYCGAVSCDQSETEQPGASHGDLLLLLLHSIGWLTHHCVIMMSPSLDSHHTEFLLQTWLLLNISTVYITIQGIMFSQNIHSIQILLRLQIELDMSG